MTLCREDTAAAYARHRALHDARRWTDLADLFRPDGSYSEPFFGRIEGRESIREFLRVSMSNLEDWVFPVDWTVVDEGRVVTQWRNRLPKSRRDGRPFEFSGISNLVYDDEGMIVLQEDTYDRVEAVRVLTEARSSVLERVGNVANMVGGPVVEVIKRVTGVA